MNKILKTFRSGFTLIELVVVVGIMTTIISITLINHSRFGGQVLLRNLGYKVALVIRKAQAYGMSVRQTKVGHDFESSYGIHFDARLNNAKESSKYFIFADTHHKNGMNNDSGGDGIYTPPHDSVVETLTIGRGYKIKKLCVTQDEHSTQEDCTNVCTSCSGSLDILFKRPEPDAAIRFNGDTSTTYSSARITLVSPRRDEIDVTVGVSGQISVSDAMRSK